MIIGIHQPNYLPWLGFFHKIHKSEKFVFLTMSQRSKSDKYLTKASIVNDGRKYLLSIPLGNRQIPINHLRMPTDLKWKKKFLNVICNSYGKSCFFEQVFPDIEALIIDKSEFFSDYSISSIKFLLRKLNIDTTLYIDSALEKDFGSSNERNINICNFFGARQYFSGVGARTYNDIDLYKDQGIEMIYQDFPFRVYNQLSTKFIPGVSVIDAIFNLGYKKTEELIKC